MPQNQENTAEDGKSIIGRIGKIIVPEKPKTDIRAHTEENMVQDYMPELKRGGAAKVEEITPSSPLDKLDGDEGQGNDEKPGQDVPKPPAKKEGKEEQKQDGQDEGLGAFKHTMSLLGGAEQAQVLAKPIRARGISIISLVLIGNVDYQKALLYLCKKFASEYSKILLITLNQSVEELAAKFLNERIDYRKFFFIDAVTLGNSRSSKGPKTENCIYVSNPNSLVELSLGIAQAMKNDVDLVVFDSLSTQLIYEKDNTISKFAHSAIGKIRNAGLNAYFMALEEDSKRESIKDISLFVDKVVDFRQFIAQEYETFGVVPLAQQTFGQTPPDRNIIRNELDVLRQSIEGAQSDGRLRGSIEELREKLSRLEDVRDKISRLENLGESEREKFTRMGESIEEVRQKLGKLDSLALLEDRIRDIYRKIDEHDEKSQLSSDLKKSIESQKGAELKESIDDLKTRIKGLEGLTSLQGEVHDITKKISEAESLIQKTAEGTKFAEAESMREFSRQIDSLARRLEDSQKTDKIENRLTSFSNELSELAKKIVEVSESAQEKAKSDMQENSRLVVSINEINTKLSRLENLGSIEQHLKQLESKIEEHDEKSQLSSDLKKSIESQKNAELREAIEDIKSRMKSSDTSALDKEIKDEGARLSQTQQDIWKTLKENREMSEESIKQLSRQLEVVRDKIETASGQTDGKQDAKIIGKISGLETVLSRLERKIEALEVKKHLDESDYDIRNLSDQRRALEGTGRISEGEREGEIEQQLEQIRITELDMEEKRKTLAKKLSLLRSDQSSKKTS